MRDLFHKDFPDEFIKQVFEVMNKVHSLFASTCVILYN